MTISGLNGKDDTRTEHVIASNYDAAKRVATKIAAGFYGRLYRSRAEALEALNHYLPWERGNYRVFTIEVAPEDWRAITFINESARERFAC